MTKSVFTLLAERYADPGWAYFAEVHSTLGYTSTRRRADAIAMSLWGSRGFEVHGHEVKTDRSDLLRELKDPAKAEAIHKYCDRWWLVLSDKDLIKPGELPPTWGLLVPRGGVLRAAKAAPKLEPKSLDRGFLAALLRKAKENTVPAHVHRELVEDIDKRATERAEELATVKAARAQAENQGKIAGLQRALEARDTSIRNFTARTGIDIELSSWRGGEHAAAVARFAAFLLVQGHDIGQLAGNLEEAGRLARAAASTLPPAGDFTFTMRPPAVDEQLAWVKDPSKSLELALRNCLALARAKQKRPDREGDWSDIERFCRDAGVVPTILRTADETTHEFVERLLDDNPDGEGESDAEGI